MERMRQRGVKQGDAWATWRNPEHSKKGTIFGSWVYYRNYNGTQIEVVAKQNEKKEWIILSVWSNIVPGSKTSFWRTLYNLLFTK